MSLVSLLALCVPGKPQSLRDAAQLDAEGRCDEAEQLYVTALAREPQSIPVLNNAGNHYLVCGDAAKAEEYFLRLLRINPRHGNANLQLARIAGERKQGAQALAYLAAVNTTGPQVSLIRAEALHWVGRKSASLAILDDVRKAAAGNPEVLQLLALSCARLGLFERAETAFNDALTLRPDDFDLTFAVGRAAARAQHYERARRALEAALTMRPEDVDVLVELGRVYAARQDYARAVFHLARARQKVPANPEVLLLLARAAEDAGYYDDAAASYDDYLKLRPQDDGARRDRARVYGQSESRRDEARVELTWYLAKHPDDPVAHHAFAQVFWSEEPEQALLHLTQATRLDPNSASIRFSRGWMLQRLGRMAESLPDLEAANRLAPGHVRILDLIGLARLSLDQPVEAEKVLRQALAKTPDDPQAVMHIGRALMAQGREQEALDFLNHYQKIRPRESPGLRTRSGMIDLATLPAPEQRARQIDWYRKETSLRPDRPDYQLHFASVLLADGQKEPALEQFRRLLELNASPALWEEAGETLLSAREYRLARPFLQRAADSRPNARLNLAIATYYEDGPVAALELLRKRRTGEATGDELLLEANLLETAGQTDESVKVLNRALTHVSGRPPVVQRAVSSLVRLHRFKDALLLLDNTIRLNPDDSDLALSKGIVLTLAGQLPAADETFRQVELRWPEWWKGHLAHGLLLERLSRITAARQRLQVASALAPADAGGARCALARVATHAQAGACDCGARLEELLFGSCGGR